MIWLILAIISYIFFGVTAVIDKFLLTKTLSAPKMYAFITGILGAFVIPLILFVDISRITAFQIITGLTAGLILTPALLVFYEALKRYETSGNANLWRVNANIYFSPCPNFLWR